MARIYLAVIVLIGVSTLSCAKRATEPAPVMSVKFGNDTPFETRRSQPAAMREFLWTNWQARRPAALLVTYISKEGKRTDSSYEIKFVTRSAVLLHVVDTQYGYGYNGQVIKHDEARPDVYKIERVSPSKPCPFDLNARVEALPDNAHLAGFDYCLRFTGWADETVGSL